MIYFRTVLCLALVTVFAYRQVSAAGAICAGDNDCGFNENCNINLDMDAPCAKGLCICNQGYIADSSTVCQKIISRKINDTCAGLIYEALPANAVCLNKVVKCATGFVVSSNTCIRPVVNTNAPGAVSTLNQQGEYAPCQSSQDCMGDMTCGNGAKWICVCHAAYMRFDMVRQKCVRREFGDPCQRDAQCLVYAHPWTNWFTNFDGYTYREGRCHNGRCDCMDDNGVAKTRISLFDQNMTYVTKTICVANGTTAAKKGQRCTLNPIGYARSTQTSICEVNTICYQCPEEYSMDNYGTQIGTCRAVKNQVPRDIQAGPQVNIDVNFYKSLDGSLPPGYDQYGYSITTSTSTAKPQSTEPVLIRKLGNICTTNSDCGTNEICNIATNVDTPCAKGFCACKPCYAVDAIMKLCYPLMGRTLGDVCYNSPNEVLPKNAMCDRGLVRCKWGYAPSIFGGDCTRQRGVGGYGDDCMYDSQCIQGLYCNLDYYMCDCEHVYQMWDNSTQTCINREFGDVCSAEDECRVTGGDWLGFTYAGGTCYRGRCACGEHNQKATVGYVDVDTGNFKTKTICVSDGATLSIAKGGRCTLDPIKYGQQPSTRICGITNMCYQCPEDYFTLGPMSTGDGFCRAVSRSPPQPNCDAFLTTTTSSPQFGLK